MKCDIINGEQDQVVKKLHRMHSINRVTKKRRSHTLQIIIMMTAACMHTLLQCYYELVALYEYSALLCITNLSSTK